jgi:hypothetical protein
MIDDAAQWVTDQLTGLTAAEVRRYLIVLVAALIAYRLLAVVLRRLLPAVLRGLVTVGHGGLAALAVLGLLTEGLCSRLFRVARLRPPRFLYRSGDALAAGMRLVRSRAPRLEWHTHALDRTPRSAVLLVAAFLCWQGHVFACDRDATADMCRRPATAIADLADQAWANGRRAVTGRA